MTLLTESADIRHILTESKTIAVVGFHRDPTKPAHYVPEYLHRQGYKIFPVNPAFAGTESLFGSRVAATLTELTVPIDVVEVFRRSDQVSTHLSDILDMEPAPRVVWLQLGIRDDTTALALTKQGIHVIQDRCMLADHRALL